YRGSVCQGQYCLGTASLALGDRKTAQHHFQEALPMREALFREAREKKILRVQDYMTLTLTLARCGNHARAAELAAEVRPQADARVLAEEIAGTYAVCLAAVGADKTPEQLTNEEKQLRGHYLELALGALEEGRQKGYTTILFLQRDPDIEPLHGIPAFDKWLAEFERSLKLLQDHSSWVAPPDHDEQFTGSILTTWVTPS